MDHAVTTKVENEKMKRNENYIKFAIPYLP